jgi:hypothetical protein
VEGRGLRGVKCPPPPKNSPYLGKIPTYVSIAHPHQLIEGKFAHLSLWFIFSAPSLILLAVSVIMLENLQRLKSTQALFIYFLFFQKAPFELCFTKNAPFN